MSQSTHLLRHLAAGSTGVVVKRKSGYSKAIARIIEIEALEQKLMHLTSLYPILKGVKDKHLALKVKLNEMKERLADIDNSSERAKALKQRILQLEKLV